MALALLRNLDDTRLEKLGKTGKTCSGCDPDMPGHVNRNSCKKCKGSGFEPFSFSSTAAEIAESKLSDEPKGKGKRQMDGEDDDASLYLEY